jgi:hypothetical protein
VHSRGKTSRVGSPIATIKKVFDDTGCRDELSLEISAEDGDYSEWAIVWEKAVTRHFTMRINQKEFLKIVETALATGFISPEALLKGIHDQAANSASAPEQQSGTKLHQPG